MENIDFVRKLQITTHYSTLGKSSYSSSKTDTLFILYSEDELIGKTEVLPDDLKEKILTREIDYEVRTEEIFSNSMAELK